MALAPIAMPIVKLLRLRLLPRRRAPRTLLSVVQAEFELPISGTTGLRLLLRRPLDALALALLLVPLPSSLSLSTRPTTKTTTTTSIETKTTLTTKATATTIS